MSPLAQNFTDLFSFGTVVLDLSGAILFLILISPLKRKGLGKEIAEFIGERAILFSFILVFLAVVGSLFYSEVAGFAPCLLCWWQRIFLYPQAVLLLTAFIKKDENMRFHSIVLSIIGGLIALYHTFIQFGGESAIPCTANGVSCQTLYFLKYGYVTIPTMSLTIFGLIILFMLSPNPKKRELMEI